LQFYKTFTQINEPLTVFVEAVNFLKIGMKKEELLKMLIDEREYHSTHPIEVRTSFIYSLGATLTTIIAGFLFKGNNEKLKEIINSHFFLGAGIFLIIIGYIIIFFAIAEHSKFHKLQLDRLENAIEYLMDPRINYTYEDFWGNFGEKLRDKNSNEYHVKLIAKEPDVRPGIHFHDRKIEIGVYTILSGALILITLIIIKCSH
jgi:hypothetical protein